MFINLQIIFLELSLVSYNKTSERVPLILCLVIISERETHVHIPNTLVKPPTANGSAVYCGVRVGRRQALSFYKL